MTSDGEAELSSLARERNLQLLLRALTEALKVLTQGGDQVAALQESFSLAMAGLQAEKGLLLYVSHQVPEVALEIIHSAGLSLEQQEACREMRSVAEEGVSPSVIRDAISRGLPVYIENSAEQRDRWKTTSLEGAHSVLCAPVIDPATNLPIAVLYFQSKGVLKSFEEEDLAWLTAYAVALSQSFGLHLNRRERITQLEAQIRGLGAPEIVGDSVWTQKLIDHLGRLLPATALENPKPILITGPSGSGKEVVARYLHHYSPFRSKGPFIAVNCTELSGDLAKTALSGHVKGAFTGAIAHALGHIRNAHKGVLFLDEVGDLPLASQGLLLRVLETREVQPLGDSRTQRVDVLIVAATNRDLDARVKESLFREDLLMRLRAFQVRLLPLSDPARRSDIRPLLTYFLKRHERLMRRKTAGLSAEAGKALMAYSWPGNVRELDTVCANLVLFATDGAQIGESNLAESCEQVLRGEKVPDAEEYLSGDLPYEDALYRWKRDFVRRRIEQHGNNYAAAARSLGIASNRLFEMRKALGLVERKNGVSNGDAPVQGDA